MVLILGHCKLLVWVTFLALVASMEQTETSAQYSVNGSPLWSNIWKDQGVDCERTNWVHTAKTSSTFCMVLQHVCCPTQWQNLTAGVTYKDLRLAMATPRSRAQSEYSFESHYCYKFKRKGYAPMACQFAGRPEHLPLSPQIKLTEKMGIIIIREPKSRLISSFLDGVHMEGFTNRAAAHELRNLFHTMDLNTSMPRQERLLIQAQMYADQKVLYGHQVKMLLGGFDADLSVRNETIMVQLVDRAVQRLREFFFVGLFEEYSRSLRLFHELANKGTTPTDVELFPMRGTNSTEKAFLMEHIVFDDPYDTLLHQAAQKIFQEELDYVEKWKNVKV